MRVCSSQMKPGARTRKRKGRRLPASYGNLRDADALRAVELSVATQVRSVPLREAECRLIFFSRYRGRLESKFKVVCTELAVRRNASVSTWPAAGARISGRYPSIPRPAAPSRGRSAARRCEGALFLRVASRERGCRVRSYY